MIRFYKRPLQEICVIGKVIRKFSAWKKTDTLPRNKMSVLKMGYV